MARAAKAAVRIRILPHRSVLIEGRAVEAGGEADVATANAEALISEGYAELASKPPATDAKPKGRAKRAALKPLTPRAIEDGEEERGG